MRRAVLVGVVGLLLVLIGAGSADAHAYLEDSNPADGSSVATPPRQIRLSFSEHVVLGATRVTLTDAAGHQVAPTHLHLLSADATDTEEPATVVGTLPELARGTWRVSWETLSSDDLHRTAGFLVFGVATTVAATPFQESPPAPVDVGLAVALLIGLALTLGGFLAVHVLARVPGHGAALARHTLVALVRGGALLALAAGVVQPLVQTGRGGVPLAELAGTSYGQRWSVREVGLLVLVVAAWSLGDAARRRWTRRLLLVGAPLATTGTALLGHAAAGVHLHLDRVLVTTVHLGAALTWSGAVGCLALVIVVPRLGGALPVPPLRATLRAFGAPAFACVALLVVTGLYLTSEMVVSVDAALRTSYGRTLLVKLVLVGFVGALALVNHRRLRGPHDLQVPSRSVTLEASAAALVVLASAVLVSSQTATDPQLVATRSAVTPGPLSRQVADLQQTVGVSPNRPGPAVVSVTVFDTRRPSPGPVTQVLVGIGAEPLVAATAVGDGRWVAPVAHLRPGISPVHVRVVRSGATTVASTVRWTAGPGTDPPATLVSRRPVRLPLLLLSGGSGLLLLAGSGLAVVRRRRRTPVAPSVHEPAPILTTRT